MNSFLGIPLRSQHKGDIEFVESVRSSIKNRKYIRIFCAIIAISSMIMLYLYFMFFLNNKIEYFEMRNFQRIGFISAFIFNSICFYAFVNLIIAMTNWFDGIPFHRKEDLLIKCYDELNKKLPNYNPQIFMNSFFGMPLRSQNKGDDEFIESVRNNIKKRKHIRPVWAIIPFSLGVALIYCFMSLLNPELEYIPEIWKSQWRGFVHGCIYGGICFQCVFYFIFAIVLCFDGLEIHRIEELLIKYYDELKKNIHDKDSISSEV